MMPPSPRFSLRQFLRQVGWVGAGEMTKICASFISIPILVRAMSVTAFGVLSLSKVSIAIGLPLLLCGLHEAFLKFASGDSDRQRVRQRYATDLWVIAGAGVLAVVGLTAAGPLLHQGFRTDLTWWLVPLIGALIAVGALDAYLQSVLQTLQRMRANAAWVIAQALVELGLCVGVAVTHRGVVELLMGFLIARSASVAGRMSLLWRDLPWGRPQWSYLKEELRYGVPLMGLSFLWFLLNFVDRYIINAYWSTAEVAIYSVVYAVGNLTSMVMTPVEFVAYPVIAAAWNQQQRREAGEAIGQSLRIALALAIPCVVFLTAYAGETLTWIATPAYRMGATSLPWVALGFLLLGYGVVGERVLALTQRLRQLGWLYAGLVALNVGMNVWLVPILGLQGAAIATCVSFAGYALGMLWCARRVVWFPLAWSAGLGYLAAAMLVMAGWRWLGWSTSPLWLSALVMGAAYLGLLQLRRMIGWRTHGLSASRNVLVSSVNLRP